jgi:hypothetical protein
MMAAPAFQGDHRPIDDATAERIRGVSWRPGCPVGLDDLRLLTVDHWGFDRAVHRGEMIVHAHHAEGVVEVFRRLHAARFPIERMELVETFDGDDDASMAANNTSGFNCRTVPGTACISQHASGLAIDINPVQNPYLPGDGVIMPPQGGSYVDRSRDEPGMIHPDGPVVDAFDAIGWHWGGAWAEKKDYHHFSANGR